MFAVLSMEAVPDHLRGYVSRFLVEAHTGLYVGVVTPRVADGIWEQVVDKATSGTATMIVSDPDRESGFSLRLHGSTTHRVADLDGIDMPVRLPSVKG